VGGQGGEAPLKLNALLCCHMPKIALAAVFMSCLWLLTAAACSTNICAFICYAMHPNIMGIPPVNSTLSPEAAIKCFETSLSSLCNSKNSTFTKKSFSAIAGECGTTLVSNFYSASTLLAMRTAEIATSCLSVRHVPVFVQRNEDRAVYIIR